MVARTETHIDTTRIQDRVESALPIIGNGESDTAEPDSLRNDSRNVEMPGYIDALKREIPLGRVASPATLRMPCYGSLLGLMSRVSIYPSAAVCNYTVSLFRTRLPDAFAHDHGSG
jgi:hypothetical protein